MKNLIGVDLDNVVFDTFKETMRDFGVEDKFNEIDKYDMCDLLNVSRKELHEYYKDPIPYMRARLIDGAKESLNKIKLDSEIVYVTARPPSDEIVQYTMSKIYYEGLPCDRIVFTSDKEDYYVPKWFNAVIDDCPKVVNKLKGNVLGIHFWQFPNCRDYILPTVEKAKGWNDVIKILKKHNFVR